MKTTFLSRRKSGDTDIWEDSAPADESTGWVRYFRLWGVPLSAVSVLVLCAPGEQHIAELSGWHGWISWGLAGLFTLYAGLAAVISTQLPEGARGKTSSVWGAVISLALAMAAQPVSHMFVTGYLSASPRPPLWLVATVSCVPPFILGHLLHFAAMPSRSVSRPGQDRDTLAPVATVTRLKPRHVPSPVPVPTAPVSRPSVPAAPVRLSLSKGLSPTVSPGRTAGQPSMSSRALSLLKDGTPEDKVRDVLVQEYPQPDGTPPKTNSVTKSINRAKDKLGQSRP